MAVFSLRKVQRIAGEPGSIWSFFADPGNLPRITPPYMEFRILSPDDQSPTNDLARSPQKPRIYPGQIIEYKLRPLPLFWVYWMTEITHVYEGQHIADHPDPVSPYFIDEQRHGPYRIWHHQHHFKPIPGGVEMTDIIHYEIPYGFIGNWANSLFVRKQLEGLFEFRFKKVEELFGVY